MKTAKLVIGILRIVLTMVVFIPILRGHGGGCVGK